MQTAGAAVAGPPAGPGGAIPVRIFNRLVALRPCLELQGNLQLRRERDRRPSWRLRCRVNDPEAGRQSHVGIPIGPDHVADAVADLIEGWRAEAQAAARRARRLEARQSVLYRRIVELTVPGGRDHRRRAGRDFAKALGAGVAETWGFVRTIDMRYHPPRRGRPPKARLW